MQLNGFSQYKRTQVTNTGQKQKNKKRTLPGPPKLPLCRLALSFLSMQSYRMSILCLPSFAQHYVYEIQIHCVNSYRLLVLIPLWQPAV